uniref:Uncharacterized protein n=1 Tax=Hainan astro-like virus 2 TaxID=2116150 RepID=A0A2P1GN99_9VIRU|nr:hypothetical protein [Hainan astro-like virus 2]
MSVTTLRGKIYTLSSLRKQVPEESFLQSISISDFRYTVTYLLETTRKQVPLSLLNFNTHFFAGGFGKRVGPLTISEFSIFYDLFGVQLTIDNILDRRLTDSFSFKGINYLEISDRCFYQLIYQVRLDCFTFIPTTTYQVRISCIHAENGFTRFPDITLDTN